MKMYARYVDDGTVVCRSVPAEEAEPGQEMDERTMKRLQSIGNSIHPSIQLTIDFPSKNENHRIPILDTEQWIEEVEVKGERKTQVLYSHYTKPIANKHLIHRDSAIPTRSKLNILIADLVRITKNISRLCKPDERVTKVQEFIHRIQYSGYSKRERAEVYTKAKNRYDKGVSDNAIGKVPMYRNKD